MSETAEVDTDQDEGWLATGAVARMKRKANGRWWPMTGVIDGVTTDDRYMLRDQATGERWLPKIDGGVLEIVEVIHPGHPEAERTLSYAEAMAWKREALTLHDQAIYEVLAAADEWVDAQEEAGRPHSTRAYQKLTRAVRAWRAVHPS